MIASHRRRHHHLWLALAVALPLIFALAWFARNPPAMMEKLPDVLTQAPTP